jgi:hypothetical protein
MQQKIKCVILFAKALYQLALATSSVLSNPQSYINIALAALHMPKKAATRLKDARRMSEYPQQKNTRKKSE